MALNHSPRIVTNGLVMCLDANNPKSYPGSGTAWYDISGSNYTHTLFGGAAITTVDSVRCFDVSTAGKYIADAGSTYTFGAYHTMIAWARPLADSQVTDWRTLWRTTPDDHTILIQDGTNLIGYYDNNSGGFVSYGVNAGTIGIENKWTMFSVVASSGSSTLYVNEGTNTGTVPYTAASTSHDLFGAAGGSQPFGYVAIAKLYSRALTLSEIQQNFNALRGRFGI